MPLDTLENTLAHELSDLYSAENQFAKALQQTVKNADSAAVKQMAQEHHAETLAQIENLKKAFISLGQKPERGRHFDAGRRQRGFREKAWPRA